MTGSLHCCMVLFGLIVCLLSIDAAKKDERECEVCIGAINAFKKDLKDDVISKPDKLEAAFKKYCKKIPKGGKENRFCYFVGGTDDAATGILNNLIKPMSYHMPPEKICAKLKSMDNQICELRYDVKPDFSKLKKMRVGELKKILSNWGQDNACKGCAEKSDFVKKVRELLPKYEPEEWKKLEAAEKSEL